MDATRTDPRDSITTAAELMRSRFEAFQAGDAAWLLRSWHPSTRPPEVDLDDNPTWRRLQIVETVHGEPGDTTGIVEFRASWVRGDEHGVMRERSRFVHDGGRWYYVDGEQLG